MSCLPVQINYEDFKPRRGESALVPIVKSVEDFLSGQEPQGYVPVPDYVAEMHGFCIALRIPQDNRRERLEPYVPFGSLAVVWYGNPAGPNLHLGYNGQLVVITDKDGRDWIRWAWWGENDVLLRCKGENDKTGKYLDHTISKNDIKYWPPGLVVQVTTPRWGTEIPQEGVRFGPGFSITVDVDYVEKLARKVIAEKEASQLDD